MEVTFKLTRHRGQAHAGQPVRASSIGTHQMTRDRRLDEVKAVLRRLQNISVESASVGPTDATATETRRSSARRGTMVVTMLAAIAVLIGLGTYAFISFEGSTASTARRSPSRAPEGAVALRDTPPPSNAPPQPTPPAAHAVLERALQLMTGGRVEAARSELLRIDPEGSADVAWALARSYDPNFLSTVPAADAAPNIAEATRWYRTWYALAVKEGLVADSVSPERIIRSMR